MGWLGRIFRRKPKQTSFADSLSGFTPIFSQFGTNIYASDVVQQAVSCIVTEMKKLNPTHVRKKDNNDIVNVNGNIQTILNNPNEFMTTSDFIEKIMWSLLLNENAFVVPPYYIWKDEKGNTKKRYTALYPVQPTQVNFIQDASEQLFVELIFANGYKTTLRYSDIIHIRRNYSVNDYMGGDESGQPKHDSLLKTLELNQTLLQGVAKAMKSAFAINGVIKYNTMMDEGNTERALQELEAKLRNNESGFLPLDLKGEFIPIKREVELVDADTLKFIDEKILRNWGVPLCILTGNYTKSQYEAFYQKTLEPYIISISQAFTKGLFSENERSYGNRIQLYPKDLIFMDIGQTLEMIRLLGDSGALFENEKRTALGMKPLKELEGVRKQSLNYVDVNIVNDYQMNQTKKTGGC
ncbi:MAG: phage portal protein [Lachnospiraceae bacterium]|nr:phage portal protein [Lachnospiraceae bacterium]